MGLLPPLIERSAARHSSNEFVGTLDPALGREAAALGVGVITGRSTAGGGADA
ncbi:hypothetical protein BRCON_0168 [Candidatus Sumerlaea chitinivorans]|uniref:Uncharacterized protein n=1 Tax=Sumerlaea chitinivorans TaxID=2250252 RepID=A0A2Z4Y3A1_SUMC1|nr:hypothetical protein BRCON_0168 [Candidatus Sumerlaea chitinivorans]